jgi:hypothetical protein
MTEPTASVNISSITPGLSYEDFANYKPDLTQAQGFDSNRKREVNGRKVNRPHRAIDYDEKAGIRVGTKITSVLDGEATPIYNFYPKNNPKDSAVVVKGKDPISGGVVTITYGHLSRESVKKLFNGKNSVPVKSGDILGAVDRYGAVGGNDAHVHVIVVVDGKVVDPIKYFKDLEKYRTKSSDKSADKLNSDSPKSTQAGQEKPIAMQRYEAIAEILEQGGIQKGGSDWNQAVVRTAIGTDLNIGDVKDIAKQIPGVSADMADKLIASNAKNAQAELALLYPC